MVVAVDARDGLVALDGWEQTSSRTALDVVHAFEGTAGSALIHTDVARDGTQAGPNIAATRALASAVAIPVLASGGVDMLARLRSLAAIPNVAGAIIDRALYERSFSLEDAITAASFV